MAKKHARAVKLHAEPLLVESVVGQNTPSNQYEMGSGPAHRQRFVRETVSAPAAMSAPLCG